MTEKKLGALTILSFIIGSPIVVAFLSWLSLSVVEANRKNAEQDQKIEYNTKGIEASIKTNQLLCEMVIESNDVAKRKRFCVRE